MGSYSVYILEYQSSNTAEEGTTTTQIKITDHGLSPLDFIVNASVRSSEAANYGRDAERCGRLVYDVEFDEDTLPLETAIFGQTSGDSIRLYKYVDRSGLLRPGTFRLIRRGGGQSELSFEIVTTAEYLMRPGMYVKVVYDDGSTLHKHFSGVITSATRKPAFDGSDTILQSVQCDGMRHIATRRTIRIDYPAGTLCGDIVSDMVDDYLFQDLVRKSTIDNGAALEEDWFNDVVSISDVLDQCATLSGYAWFIDDDGLMNFYHEVTNVDSAPVDLNGTTFKLFRNVQLTEDINNYMNKVFLSAGVDETGNPIIFGSENFAESADMQWLCGGTGVYGHVIRDTSMVESDYKTVESGSTSTAINITAHGQEVGDIVWNYSRNEYRQVIEKPSANQFIVDAFSGMSTQTSDTAEAGTNTTTIVMTAHGLAVGDMIYNSTRGAYRTVLKVTDVNTITVAAVTSQTSGDTIKRGGDIIAFFNQANDALQNAIKKQGVYPATVMFETSREDFSPLTKLLVNLPNLGISNEYYLIEDVEVYDFGRGLSNAWCKIKATRRNNDNFSTQRNLNGYDYWRDR
jgi:hypothetical protein